MAKPEFPISEGCFISEWWNTPQDPAVSVARARVPPAVTTRWHRLSGVVERYVIVEGRGRAYVGDSEPQDVAPGDVVFIPAGCRQRITNIGEGDLVFLAVCTPRFTLHAYEALG